MRPKQDIVQRIVTEHKTFAQSGQALGATTDNHTIRILDDLAWCYGFKRADLKFSGPNNHACGGHFLDKGSTAIPPGQEKVVVVALNDAGGVLGLGCTPKCFEKSRRRAIYITLAEK